MERTFKDILRLLLPMSKKTKQRLVHIGKTVSAGQLADIRYLVKTKKVGVLEEKLPGLVDDIILYKLHAFTETQQVHRFITDINEIITTKTREKQFKSFSKQAKNTLLSAIAPNIIGMEYEKMTALLQLFAKERVHILLLGDPGTGKTDLLRSAAQLAPISSFGLGSGTSGAGLSIAMHGNEKQEGLLVQAQDGICCIDELNLMKKEDRAALYSAMEKGFISYDKGGKHEKIPANTRVFATANPTGDKFIGKALSLLRQQVPFDSALLTRFHVVFVIRQPSEKELLEISKNIVERKEVKLSQKKVDFFKDYIAYAQELKVDFPSHLSNQVTQFIHDAKKDEDEYLIEVGPRTVHGIMRLAQAHARLHLRTKVEEEDVKIACSLLKASFQVPGIFGPVKG